jgi:diguanylate cyclase (GGDEF)-like protein
MKDTSTKSWPGSPGGSVDRTFERNVAEPARALMFPAASPKTADTEAPPPDRRRLSVASPIELKRSLPGAWGLVLLIGALALIFAADHASGSAPVQHLYYAPIIFASLRFGYRGSIAVAIAAVVLYHLANPHVLTLRYEESDIVQIALFVAVALTSGRLTEDARRLRHLAITDDLTGLHNLRSFEVRLRAFVQEARRTSAPLSLLALDLDRLKSLNDTHGHLVGGDAVRTVGLLIAAHIPPDAVACRYGGDEFVIALPRCSTTAARRVADDVRHAVSACAPVLDRISFPAGTLSISIGVACRQFEQAVDRRPDSGDAHAADVIGEDLFRAADSALYAAKEHGRNRVCVSGPG